MGVGDGRWAWGVKAQAGPRVFIPLKIKLDYLERKLPHRQ